MCRNLYEFIVVLVYLILFMVLFIVLFMVLFIVLFMVLCFWNVIPRVIRPGVMLSLEDLKYPINYMQLSALDNISLISGLSKLLHYVLSHCNTNMITFPHFEDQVQWQSWRS